MLTLSHAATAKLNKFLFKRDKSIFFKITNTQMTISKNKKYMFPKRSLG